MAQTQRSRPAEADLHHTSPLPRRRPGSWHARLPAATREVLVAALDDAILFTELLPAGDRELSQRRYLPLLDSLERDEDPPLPPDG